jgi:uncharacterized membrane protein YphA (DoxX/SURF4 family)
VSVWAVRVALAAQFGAGGAGKIAGTDQMVRMFDDIGAGQWFRVLVGVLEIAGAVGLLVPRLAGAAAAGLVGLMIGAVVTNVAILGSSPIPPLAFGVLAAVVAYARRQQLVVLGRSVRR